MVRQFVLVDAIPGREEAVFRNLDEVEGLVGKRRLNPKIRNQDILILLEGKTEDDIRKVLSEAVRGLAGVGSVTTVTPDVEEAGLRDQMDALEADVST